MNINKTLMICTNSNNALQLNESEMQNSSEKYILEGVFAELDKLNRNQRIYPKEEYLKHLQYLRNDIKNGIPLLGELDHPDDRFEVKLKEASHRIIDLWYDEKTNCVMGKIELLNTPNGKLAQSMVDQKIPLHISSRASGSVNEDHTVDINQIFTYDLVCKPGFSGAVLYRINESSDENIYSNYSKDVVLFLKKMQNDLKLNHATKYGIVNENISIKEINASTILRKEAQEIEINKKIELNKSMSVKNNTISESKESEIGQPLDISGNGAANLGIPTASTDLQENKDLSDDTDDKDKSENKKDKSENKEKEETENKDKKNDDKDKSDVDILDVKPIFDNNLEIIDVKPLFDEKDKAKADKNKEVKDDIKDDDVVKEETELDNKTSDDIIILNNIAWDTNYLMENNLPIYKNYLDSVNKLKEEGKRLPTVDEIKKLISEYYKWDDTAHGAYIGNDKLFFTASGYKDSKTNEDNQINEKGYLWLNSESVPENKGFGVYLGFDSQGTSYPNAAEETMLMPIRGIKDKDSEEAQEDNKEDIKDNADTKDLEKVAKDVTDINDESTKTIETKKEKFEKKIDDLIAVIKKKSESEKDTKNEAMIMAKYPESMKLNESNYSKFSKLDEQQKTKVITYLRDNKIELDSSINESWENGINYIPKVKDPIWLASAPDDYKKIFESSSDTVKNAIKTQAEYLLFESQSDINTFWKNSGLKKIEDLKLMNESFVSVLPKIAEPVQSENILPYSKNFINMITEMAMEYK